MNHNLNSLFLIFVTSISKERDGSGVVREGLEGIETRDV